MKFLLTINCDNAAFHGDGCQEEEHVCPGQTLQIAHILREILDRFDSYYLESPSIGIAWDSNGNGVGGYSFGPG